MGNNLRDFWRLTTCACKVLVTLGVGYFWLAAFLNAL